MKKSLQKSLWLATCLAQVSFVSSFSIVFEQYENQCLHFFRFCKSTFILNEIDIPYFVRSANF